MARASSSTLFSDRRETRDLRSTGCSIGRVQFQIGRQRGSGTRLSTTKTLPSGRRNSRGDRISVIRKRARTEDIPDLNVVMRTICDDVMLC